MASSLSETLPRSGDAQHHPVPVIGPRLRKLLFVVFSLFALLGVNSVYLSSITFAEWLTGHIYQDYFYQLMFLFHLVAGLLIVIPFLVFGLGHLRNGIRRPNRRVVRAGIALFCSALVLIFSGFVLTRFDFFEIRNPDVRAVSYWVHVVMALAVIWFFVLHRLVGRRVRWRVGIAWAAFAAVFALAMLGVQAKDPRDWRPDDAASGERDFSPSLARTASGALIPASALMMDDYCQPCHQDVHAAWSNSAHRFSSFNNPAYLFSVRETRRVLSERDGTAEGSRFCAGCHDPVPLFSGVFDDPGFDVDHPTARAGLTCSACHAITRVNSRRGNADYTIDEPIHYPFAYSKDPVLKWVNHQLVKAKPEFHKQTFLKDLHKDAEFCSVCHKVFIPEEINQYKWLRGQNHYDSYLLSGVSGHGASSFYYPPKAIDKCADCHMPLQPSADFGANFFDDTGVLKVHDHLFPAANTAVPRMVGLDESVVSRHQSYLQSRLRLDILALRAGGTLDGELTAPIRPVVPKLEPGETYLLDVVIRTTAMGHLFTQGTADSNEVWLDVTALDGDRVIGRSGGLGENGEVDPWSHFVNAYVLDRAGNRIDRRNAQDIFVALYNHQIPPGAADVVHLRFRVPPDADGPLTVRASLRYRKFDTRYLQYIEGKEFAGNGLPVSILAQDEVRFEVAGGAVVASEQKSDIEAWQRWNDYGIGLLRKGSKGSSKGELRQAEQAFFAVEGLGRADGPVNLARVYLKEGRLDDAVAALKRAAKHEPPAPAWTVAWLTALVNKENGYLDEAIADLTSVVETRFNDARRRGFDFSLDYRVLNELGQTLLERSKTERGDRRRDQRVGFLNEAKARFEQTLALDPENVSAHFNLALIYGQLGQPEMAATHRSLHARYKPDDNAGDRAIALHRSRNPAANHAAEAVVIYDLQREGAFELPATHQSDQSYAEVSTIEP